jgi:hypothetical protein
MTTIECEICQSAIEVLVRPGPRPRYCGTKCRRRAETLRRIDAELAQPEKWDGRHEWLLSRRAAIVQPSVLALPDTCVKHLRFMRRRNGDGDYLPTTGTRFAFMAPVSLLSGRILEPVPGGGWRAAEHAPAHDPARVIAWLTRQDELELKRLRKQLGQLGRSTALRGGDSR